MHAYDYDAQQWVEGEPARKPLIAQLKENLTLMSSDRAEDYLWFSQRIDDPNPPDTPFEARKRIRLRLQELGAR